MDLKPVFDQTTSKEKPSGFFYIPQDSYIIIDLDNLQKDKRYLYSDSATSCIILAVKGKSKNGNNSLAFTHLSRKKRYEYFFRIIKKEFTGPLDIYAQGANPPEEEMSMHCTDILTSWISRNTKARYEKSNNTGIYFRSATLSLGQGNPNDQNRGNYGIDLKEGTVTNKAFILKPEDRDPTKGLDAIHAIFGFGIRPRQYVRNIEEKLDKKIIEKLVKKAREHNWEKVLDYTDEEALKKFSTTPEFEPEWFIPHLKDSARFVRDYK